MAKRISGLTEKTTKNLSYLLEVDEPSGATSETESQTIETLLRTKVQSTVSWANLNTLTLSFAGVEHINLAIAVGISGVTAAIALTNIPSDCEVFLKITKGSGLLITFPGTSYGFYDQTATTLYFRITSIGSTIFVRNSSPVLVTGNTISFTPTKDYDPSTKIYSDNPAATALTFSGTPNALLTVNSLNGKLKGGTYTITGNIRSTTNTTTAVIVKKIDNYISPGYVVYFGMCNLTNLSDANSAVGYVDTDGTIYVGIGYGNRNYVFNVAINY